MREDASFIGGFDVAEPLVTTRGLICEKAVMAENLLDLQISERARIAVTSLGPGDRRIVSAWFDHLKNWRNDPFVQSKSKRLDAVEETYMLRTSDDDLAIAFQITEDKVTVLSIFREETLRMFEDAAARSAP